MPYFVFKITPGPTDLVKSLDLLGNYEKYRDAKSFVKDKRVEFGLGPDSKVQVRMVMAASALEAEEKLQEKREKPILMEWEK